MKIETLADLEALLKLCHKQHVHNVTLDGITLNLTPQDPDDKINKAGHNSADYLDPLTGQPMSDDEILFYSANGSTQRKS